MTSRRVLSMLLPAAFGDLLSLVAASFVAASVMAAPPVLEESSRLPAPPGMPCFIGAFDGNRLVCAGSGANAGSLDTHWVDLFERDAVGRWTYVTRLMTVQGTPHTLPIRVAISGNIVAFALRDSLHISELTPSGWLQTSLSRPTHIGALGPDVAISNGTIVVAGLTDRLQAVVFRKNASGE